MDGMKRKLIELRDALERLADTDEAINPKRLQADPTSRLRIACASAAE